LKEAVVDAMRRSDANAKLQPAPAAGPLTTATTGFVICLIAMITDTGARNDELLESPHQQT
jgi:hypothetical protein